MVKIEIISENLQPKLIIDAGAAPAISHAAQEFKDFVKKITNLTLTIQSEYNPDDNSYIFIGSSKGLTQFLTDNNLQLDLDEAKLGQEGAIIRNFSSTSNLIIIGLTPRAVLYGVYVLFSEFYGVRWYTSEVEYYPESPALDVDENLEYISKPKFDYRMVMDIEAQDPDFAARNRLNLSLFAEDIHGGKVIDAGKMTHTLYALVPPSKYFKDHPEYYSLLPVNKDNQPQDDIIVTEDSVIMTDPDIEMTRQAYGGGTSESVGQLCFSNPDVLDIVVDQILKWHEEQPNLIGFAVAQNDTMGFCHCPECMAINQRYGAYSGSLIDFVNKVAIRVNETLPNLFIFTLAYTYSEAPPADMEINRNAVIALCHMRPSCDSHPLVDCPANSRFVNRLLKWREIAQNIVIWHYIVDFSNYQLPFPNLYALSKDIKWYYDHGVKGALFQGCTTITNTAEFQEMKAWVLAQMSWNPTKDLWALVEEFMMAYYGPAASMLMQWLYFLNEQVQIDPTKCMHLYSGMETGILDRHVLDEGWRLFSDALKVVEDEPVLNDRVEKLTVGLIYAELKSPVNYLLKNGKIQAEDKEKRLQFLENFETLCSKFKITALTEGGGFKEFVEMVKSQLNPIDITVVLNIIDQKLISDPLNAFWKWAEEHESEDHSIDLRDIPPLKSNGITVRSFVDYLKNARLLKRIPGIELGGILNWEKIRN